MKEKDKITVKEFLKQNEKEIDNATMMIDASIDALTNNAVKKIKENKLKYIAITGGIAIIVILVIIL